jgi:predicted RNA-binding protein YlxR (DUF448 family)
MLALADPDLDNGPRTDRSATMRMCAVSREVRPIGELIRFVVSPQGEVVPDLKRKLPGRGLWVSASHKAVSEAVRRNLFGKGFKRNVQTSPTLAEDTDDLQVRGVIQALAMAAKAGQVVSGFAKVEGALQREIAALIHASDGAADGIRKLDAILRQRGGKRGESPEIPTVSEGGLPGYDVTQWYGLLLPAGAPKEIVERLNKEIARALANPKIRELYVNLGTQPLSNTPDEFATFIRNEKDKWSKVIKTANIKAD